MYQPCVFVDNDLCRIGCRLISQSIDYGLASPPLRRLRPNAIVRKLSADWLIYATF